jgi:hypothetical protein
MASQQPSDFQCVRRHDVYYIPSGDLSFLVERVLFKVHRYFFERESLFFRDKLNPTAPGSSVNGDSDGTAIIMDDVKSADFARFLWVFYNPKFSIYNATWDDWVAILGLAHKWDFPLVKELCVRELELIDNLPVERIHIYHKHDLDRNLLVPRYAELCSREEPLSLEEGMKLGLETSLMIARARETARSGTRDGTRSPLPAHVKEQDMVSLVKELFKIPVPPSAGGRAQSPTPHTNNTAGPNGAGSPPVPPPRTGSGHVPQKSSTSSAPLPPLSTGHSANGRAGGPNGQAGGAANGGANGYTNGNSNTTNGNANANGNAPRAPNGGNTAGGTFAGLGSMLSTASKLLSPGDEENGRSSPDEGTKLAKGDPTSPSTEESIGNNRRAQTTANRGGKR